MPRILKEENTLKASKVPMNKKFFRIISVLVVLVSIVTAGYFYWQYQTIKNDPGKVAEDEVRALVGRVGQLALLPLGEDPVVATITEPEKLKNQPFFVRAEKGDKLLVYNRAGKAYLYRPGLDKIIDATFFNPSQVEQSQKTPDQIRALETTPENVATSTKTQ